MIVQNEKTVRTRFAPSPTGYLHIGGVRTALFNWLFARRHGGQFILRIDDTDKQRNIREALQPILDGFRWLGLDWDEGPDVEGPYAPYFQSARDGQYREAVDRLLATGHAYRDYATAEEIHTERETAQRQKQRFTYSRRWMGDTVVQRADGSYLYHLASAVDDHDYRITHVIRAVEHLSNTPRQIFIARALDYDLPVYAHLPYVAAPGSAEKLSKRKLGSYLKQADFKKVYDHGVAIMTALGQPVSDDTFSPVIVNFYRTLGYRPEALVNYLLLLGWSLDERTEMFTLDEMIKHFTLARVNRSAASFDPQKLMAFEERYMQRLDTSERVTAVLPFLQRSGLLSPSPSPTERDRVSRVVEAAGDRLKVAGDIVNYLEFFRDDDAFAYDDKAFDKRVRVAGAPDRLRRFRDELETVASFDAKALETLMHQFIEREATSIGQVIHAVRVAVTGKAVGFGIFDGLAILGREACLVRIDRALARVTTEQP
jgi:glutamyl-tRNA synthetase